MPKKTGRPRGRTRGKMQVSLPLHMIEHIKSHAFPSWYVEQALMLKERQEQKDREREAKPNCPLETGLRPCMCENMPRCPVCNYSDHDARFEMDHSGCTGEIPGRLRKKKEGKDDV